jgi:hypothetical protein
MNYADAMNYFYSIAPFTKDVALQYALMQSLWFVFASIPIFMIIICWLFLYETKLFKKSYQKMAKFSFKNFLCSGDVLIPIGIGVVIGTLITGINSFHTKYYVDNVISKKEVIESPYFQSLDNQSKQFIKNRLIIGNDGIFKVSTLYSAFVDEQNNVDISKIDVDFFLPNIAIKDLKELINAEIEYRNARNNELEQDKNYKQEMINFIQNAK